MTLKRILQRLTKSRFSCFEMMGASAITFMYGGGVIGFAVFAVALLAVHTADYFMARKARSQ